MYEYTDICIHPQLHIDVYIYIYIYIYIYKRILFVVLCPSNIYGHIKIGTDF